MSISIDIKLTTPIDIITVLPNIGTALREILGLTFTPRLKAEEYINGRLSPLRDGKLHVETNVILIGIAKEPETASLGVYEVNSSQLSEEENGAFVYISSENQRNALELALVAAVAIALGRELGMPVIDDTPFYTDVLSQSVDNFVQAIRVKGYYDDYHVSSKVFYDALLKER